MKFELHTDHVTVEQEFRDYIEKHLQLSTKNYEKNVARLTMHLVDMNKGKGGAKDVSCKIVAHVLSPNGEVVTEGRDHDAMAAFNIANHKFGSTIVKRVERLNDHHPDKNYHHHNNPEL